MVLKVSAGIGVLRFGHSSASAFLPWIAASTWPDLASCRCLMLNVETVKYSGATSDQAWLRGGNCNSPSSTTDGLGCKSSTKTPKLTMVSRQFRPLFLDTATRTVSKKPLYQSLSSSASKRTLGDSVHAASESAHLESFRHCLRIPRCGRLSSGRITPFHNFIAQSWGSTVPQNVLTWIISNHPISLRNLFELKIGGGLRVLRDKQCSESGCKQHIPSKFMHVLEVGMDQYLLNPINTIFRGLFTSINPSYFDVNYRGIRFWHTARYLFLSVECVPCCFRSKKRDSA